MKKITRIIKQVMAGIFCVILMQCPVFLLYVDGAEAPTGLYAAGAVLMDGDSGRILYSKNGDDIYAMASTTKIMTCILALELGSLQQIVTISDYAASMPDVQMNAKAGEQYYLKDLLYSTMLESHNDSAVAVAEAIAGDVESFAKLMDQKAEAIGCTHTNFVTPNGLDDVDKEGEHVTTAKELAMILRYCVSVSSKAEEFMKICKTQNYEFQELQGKRYISCRNHNALLNSYEGLFAGKTGFTGKAGYCYTGAASRGEETMIIALLGAGWYPHKSYKWSDAKKLFDYGFENYEYKIIGKEQWELLEIPIRDGMKETGSVVTDAGTFSCLLNSDENVECKLQIAEELQAPVLKDTVVGTITYELNGIVMEQFSVRAGETVEKATFYNIVKKYLKRLQYFVGNLINK